MRYTYILEKYQPCTVHNEELTKKSKTSRIKHFSFFCIFLFSKKNFTYKSETYAKLVGKGKNFSKILLKLHLCP